MFVSSPFILITGSGPSPPVASTPVHPDLGEMAALTSMSYRTQGHGHPTAPAVVLNDAKATIPWALLLEELGTGWLSGSPGHLHLPCSSGCKVRSLPRNGDPGGTSPAARC